MLIKISFAVLLIIVFAINSHGQSLYSKQNLEKASREDLTLYLTKAQKLKKTGGVIFFVGSSALISGMLLMAAGESTAYFGIGMFVGGVGCSAIGIPILATGSSRVRKTSNAWNSKYNAVRIEMIPSNLYNFKTQNIQPGISLRIRF